MRQFGETGLLVSPVGFGAMHLDALDEAQSACLLGGVLDLGINLIDTARGYGQSEARIGRHLAHRRHEFVLSTKFGYGVEGVPDWTYSCIVKGIERALGLMRTDVIDIGHLHSCPLTVLEKGEVTQALADCVQAGKLRVAAYSGENAELAHALADPRFGSVQLSLSLVDRANAAQLPPAGRQGVLVKRSLAGMAWGQAQRPSDFCGGQYFERWQAMALPSMDAPWPEIALRFAAHAGGVSSVLVGSSKLAHIRLAVDAVSQGALDHEQLVTLATGYARAGGAHWAGVI